MARRLTDRKTKRDGKARNSAFILTVVLAAILLIPVITSSTDNPATAGESAKNRPLPLAANGDPQAFALVAPLRTETPTIDGNISLGEWDGACSDTVTLAGSDYFTVYSLINGDNLFLAVRLNGTNADSTLDDNDLCDILLDPDLSRTDAPQGGDLKIECKYSTASGSSASLEIGWAGSWVSASWPADWKAAVSNGSGEEVYEFQIGMAGINSVFESPTSGNVTGFGVFVKEQGPGSTAALYWPDDMNPSENLEDIPAAWGSLIYGRPELKVNRVFYRDSGFDERIYIYNNASTDIRLENLTLRNSAGLSVPIPQIVLPPAGTVRIINSEGTNDSDLSDGYADFFIPVGEMWEDSGDSVWLGYTGNNCTSDYMEYGSVVGAHPKNPSSTSSWIEDAPSLDTSALYFLRKADGYDSNRISDWTGENTPQAGKTLHLKTNGGADFMSTVPANASAPEVITLAARNDEYHDWTSIPFARPFHILGNASLLVHVNNNGNGISGLNATLFDGNGTALTLIGNSTVADLGVGTASGTRPVNITIPLIDYRIPQNHSLVLRITATDVPGDGETPGPPETVDIYWNSTSNDSYIFLPTDTYISVDNITYFNHSGAEWGQVIANESVDILANTSDPLGSYDISEAIVNITGPGTSTETGMALVSADGSVPSAWKLFGTSFTPLYSGNYTITVTAVESNGVRETGIIRIEVGKNTSSAPVGDRILLFPDAATEVSADSAEVEIRGVVINSTSGQPVSGVLVNWSVADFDSATNTENAFLYRNSSITNETGETTVLLYTGHHAGDNWKVLANASGITNETAEISVIPGRPWSISSVSGDGQSGTVGSFLPEPLVAEVDDRWGNSVASGWPVWFNVTDTGLNGDAHLEFPSPVLTSAQGMVENRLTLDTAPGTNRIIAEISGGGVKSAEFTAIGTAPELTIIAGSSATGVRPGAAFNYTVYINNDGSDAAENISLVWQIPDQLIYISGSHDSALSVDAGEHRWSLAEMDPDSLFTMELSVQVKSDAQDGLISTVFAATYGDRLNHPYNSSSNSVDVSVDSSTGGSPPHISGVPPLVVHYDAAYTFDLSPYIWDNDTPAENLTLSFSDPIHAWQGNGTLRMVLLYPEKYDGMQIPLTIVVSDGTSSDYQTVTVFVTSDYPPELVEPLPDVTYDEDTVVYPFNVTHYFRDPDNDSLVYTYGEVHVICDILPNGTVMFTAEKNWFGQEHITFRATDPTGALVEYTIAVTVLPVNDPPVISDIPPVEVKRGEEMTIDLSRYISDPDNPLSELTLSTNSSFASVSGLNITLLYRTGLDSDTIYLTVSDGNATASGTIGVIIIQPSIWEEIYWPYPLFLLIIPILAGLYIYTRVRVEQVFFIYNDGVLIAHETIEDRETMDKDLFSSMLTAIQDFVKDSFSGAEGQGLRLKKLEFGDRNIFIERAENAFLAVVYRGRTTGPVERKAKRAISAIKERYGEALKDWDGNMARFEGINEILFEILK